MISKYLRWICALIIISPLNSFAVDECNTTGQCRNIFGSSATDCRNSRSNQSVCMCGNSRCSNTNGGGNNNGGNNGGNNNGGQAGGNPVVQNGVAIFVRNKRIGTKFRVPNHWRKIVINRNVTVTGSFFVPSGSRSTNGLTIVGRNNATSVIRGAQPPTNIGNREARRKSAIRYEGPGELRVKNLKSMNSVKFHLWTSNKLIAENLHIVETSDTHTSDAVHAGKGSDSVVRDSYLDVFDDALYVTEVALVENTTIVHRKNGAPFQVAWGYSNFGNMRKSVIRNTEVIYDFHRRNRYNQGTLGWANHSGGPDRVHVRFENLRRTVRPGKQPMRMFQMGGTHGGSVRNATIVVEGGCRWRNEAWSNPRSNGRFVFRGC